MSLNDVLTRGDWSIDPGAYNHWMFGDQSLLVREIDAATEKGDFRSILDHLEKLSQQREAFGNLYLAVESDYPIANGLAILEGLRQSLQVVQNWIENGRDCPPTGAQAVVHLQRDLRLAMESFQRAWGDHAGERPKTHSPPAGIPDEKPLWQVVSQLGREGTNAGYWITWDIVHRLISRMAGDAEATSGWRSATTPVLLASTCLRRGLVLWLTVELTAQGGAGFDPDPLAFGLTALQRQRPNVAALPEEPDLLDIMRRVWTLSGVEGRFRGRWRITGQHPVPGTRMADQPPAYERRLAGRSVEAAALATIWAACGEVPYEQRGSQAPEPSRPLALAPDVAISACLPSTRTVPLTELRLGKVTRVGPKIRAFERFGGDSVLLSDDEDIPREEDSASRTADELSQGGNRRSAGVRIERVKTIGEALDRMLITNRYLQRWQDHQREAWLARWEHGTAEVRATTQRE